MKQFVFALGLLVSVFVVVQPVSAMEAEQKTVTNGAASIEYSVRGEGPLIMIIASTGRGTAEFAPLADRLAARGYRVALPEPRGILGSTGPMENVTFHDFADDFAAVVTAEGGRAIVVGHAYGHWIAKTIAADYPEMTRGIVLLAGAAKSWPSELSDAISVVSDPKSTREARLAGLRLAFFAKGNDPTSWLEGWHSDVIKSQSAARKLTERKDWWAGGTAQILDLQAGSDPFRPEKSRMEAKDEFGNRVTVAVIEGAGHALPAEKPIETADAIADWVDKLNNN
ncbi:putative aminoacrylate hydrolase RutD [Photorhabdus australis subsp. thailandensis]|uniref:Putative aminoacrylate hydrolase RutD n=1 Tax=Photorhabdus australis subsp. thailandensis TaxID=2805096 RepID=A0A1C0TZA8_9GAMM|nr:alpha/beta hydrolase [Photorhabdus australis]OCQ50926.1 putative aminoacrylate hydrolase RutD [Photorhabdus australis subsp. thailandensis]